MKVIHVVLLVLVGFGIAAADVLAATPDFTFKIPIELKSLRREVDKVAVVVFLFDQKPVETPYAYKDPNSPTEAGGDSVKRKVIVFPVDKRTGNFSRVVTTNVSVNHPERIEGYACVVYLHHEALKKWTSTCSEGANWCVTGNKLPSLQRFGDIP